MINRRTVSLILSGAISALGDLPIRAQEFGDTAINRAPPELGLADFADVWEFVGEDLPVAAFVPHPIPDTIVNSYNKNMHGVLGSQISDLFLDKFGRSFFSVYNEVARSAAGQSAKMRAFRDVAAQERLIRLWDSYFENNFLPAGLSLGLQQTVTFLEYLTYCIIFLHETGGTLSRGAERVNPDDPALGQPGISYLYDRFRPRGSSWQKKSYNSGLNRSCFDLFNSDLFLKHFSHLPNYDRVANTSDERWKGDRYPKSDFPVSPDPKVSGIILEADFYKFRGRGLIQTTWRSNYVDIINLILKSDVEIGDGRIVKRWRSAGRSADDIATISTNAEWDELFIDNNFVTAVAAIKLHAWRGRYMPLSESTEVINSDKNGSILAVGKRLNGGDEYSKLVRERLYLLSQRIGVL
ncbi:hypothetical protein GJ654_20395 [Rhodoblastus acidophilus]|uniref:Uncharacterized protein n=1 Tax=Rhodoblastus acidophilus TaxID=1074 RepID=A0A6N8DRZ2_RHOAC|nr:hypothetical protein [Rhodoblastus acidophilus]MCW2276522.1 hypothetical protein [Rhodoblastus acidophilus]MTV33340.1 hypothetical protein [Rhodoblastus acidophilus]